MHCISSDKEVHFGDRLTNKMACKWVLCVSHKHAEHFGVHLLTCENFEKSGVAAGQSRAGRAYRDGQGSSKSNEEASQE